MLLLNKKRISVIVIAIVLGVFSFSIQIAREANGKAVQVTALPVSGKTVILDVGHPGYLLTR